MGGERAEAPGVGGERGGVCGLGRPGVDLTFSADLGRAGAWRDTAGCPHGADSCVPKGHHGNRWLAGQGRAGARDVRFVWWEAAAVLGSGGQGPSGHSTRKWPS